MRRTWLILAMVCGVGCSDGSNPEPTCPEAEGCPSEPACAEDASSNTGRRCASSDGVPDAAAEDASPQEDAGAPDFEGDERLMVAGGPEAFLSATGGAEEGWWASSIPTNFFSGSDVATDGDGRWVIIDDIVRVLYSDDGATWNDSATPYPVAMGNDIIYDLADVEHCNGHWVIVGGTFVSFDNGVSLHSSDGETFSLASGAMEDQRYGVACDAAAGVWIAVTSSDALRSDDNGATWSVQGSVPISTRGVATAGGVWISVGGLGIASIGRTEDVTAGVDLERITAPTSEVLVGVATDGVSTFVAIGENGAIIQSADGGVSWTDVSLTAGDSWTSIAWLPGSGRFAVGDEGGQIRFSEDAGLTWSSPVPTGSERPVAGIAAEP